MYKLENNTLVSCPNEVIFEGDAILNPSDDVQIALGYKHLTTSIQPSINWFEKMVCNYTENETHIFENWSVEAQTNLQYQYIERLSVELERALFNDFSWGGNVVKLNESNQKDYLAAYTLASMQPTIYIPFQYTFKDNAKYVMPTIDEIIDFTNQSTMFVATKLEKFRTERDKALSMTNEELYDYLQSQI